jgi:hypothetical protein
VNDGFWPRHTLSQIGSAPGAIKRPGNAPDNAAKIALGMKWPITWRLATGAGSNALRMLPGGALTCTGLKLPSLCGTSGQIAALMAKLA